MTQVKWARTVVGSYEVSSKGDPRFSAFSALLPDGRSIEQWYQCDIKGYQPGGRDWKLGKGKPPKWAFAPEQLYELYLSLWRLWALHNLPLMRLLHERVSQHNWTLSDRFASTDVNQARALAQILNEWF